MYAWIPLFGALVWFCQCRAPFQIASVDPHAYLGLMFAPSGMLWAMLIVWLAEGQPKYPTMTDSIAYISDIGAEGLKPLFITGCSITAVCFVMSLVVERWLRYRGRYVADVCHVVVLHR